MANNIRSPIAKRASKIITVLLGCAMLSSCYRYPVLFPNRVHQFELSFNSAQSGDHSGAQSSSQSGSHEKINRWSYGYNVPLCRLNSRLVMHNAYTQTAQQNNPDIASLPAELKNKPFIALQLQDKSKQRAVTVALIYQAESSEVWLLVSLDNGKNEYLTRTHLNQQVEIELVPKPEGDYMLSFWSPARPLSKKQQSTSLSTSEMRDYKIKIQTPRNPASVATASDKPMAAGKPQRFDFYPDFAVQHVTVQSYAADTLLSPLTMETGCGNAMEKHPLPASVI